MARRKINLGKSMTAASSAPSGIKSKMGGVKSYPGVRKTSRPGKMMQEVGPSRMRQK
jgi:hypothetical protein